MIIVRLLFTSIFLLAASLLFSQRIDTEFGKNRVQHHDDFRYYWMYESQNFITYWYGKSRNVAESVVKLAEYDYREIQKFLEHRINDKIEIIVFTDLTDQKQSNIGNEDVFLSHKGETKIINTKMFVYFNGNHRDLRNQIRRGVARIYLTQMLSGSTLQEFVQNAIYAQLPEWYVEGLVSYVAETWNEEIDAELREVFWNERFDDFHDFGQKYPRLAGHGLWNYISFKYGNTALSNLLYLTRINRELESGFIYVIGIPYEEVVQRAFLFYEDLYSQQKTMFDPPAQTDIKVYRKRRIPRISHLSLSPDGNRLLYVTNEIGRYKLYLRDLRTGDEEVLMKGKFRNPFQETDYNYPMAEWSPDGEVVGIMYEKQDVIKYKEVNVLTGEEREQFLAPDYYRVYNFKFLGPERLVFSATQDGYSDIYIYNTTLRTTDRITQDFWDDLDAVPWTMRGREGILFSSNRQSLSFEKQEIDTVLPIDRFDLYFYPLDAVKGDSLVRLTNSPTWHERHPQAAGDGSFQFLSNKNGVWNRWKAETAEDGTIETVPMSNHAFNLTHFSISGNAVAEALEYAKLPYLYIIPAAEDEPLSGLPFTAYARGRMDLDEAVFSAGREKEKKQKQQKAEEEEYKFQTEFEDEIEVIFPEKKVPSEVDVINLPQFLAGQRYSDREVVDFRTNRALAYRLHFQIEDVSTSLDNDPLFGGLNTYAGFKKGFDFQPLGILLKARLSDVFEDYRFEFGVRVPTSFNGSEYFMVYDNRKYQWDKRIGFYRSAMRDRNDERFGNFEETRSITHIGVLEYRYPFDIFRSIRLSTTLRLDRFVFLAEEPASLRREDITQQRIGLKAEYVFDNTFDVMINIRNGTRAKLWVEGVNRFDLEFSPWAFDWTDGFMTVVGLDARHYERLAKYSILAVRLAAATTFGSEKILYYLGGVDNWLSPEYNQNIPFPPDDDFAYQAPALNMRGFRQNIRNGSNYALLNAELRIPLMHYFNRRPLKSGFLRSLQLVGFFDVGTSWHGDSPYSDDNPLNTVTLTNPVTNLTVRYFRDPVVYGYGAGVRAEIFGYFLRFDYGWGVETKERLEPRLYIALGTDF